MSDKTLLSKIQHKNFEPGEFVDIRLRTYVELTGEIDRFPWQQERDGIVINLTNPSVTVEDGKGNYLKFEVFFLQKFVLHYFDTEETLYTKSFARREDAYPFIENLYRQESFDLAGFKKEYTWAQYNLVHFKTKDFHYTLTRRRRQKYFWYTNWATAVFAPVFLFLSLLQVFKAQYGAAVLVLLITAVFWVPSLFYFLRYVKYSRDRILYMTKGSDTFQYGINGAVATYNKQEIESVVMHETRNSKSPLSAFCYLEMNFKDGAAIYIPNSLVERTELLNKLSQFSIRYEGGPPSIPR